MKYPLTDHQKAEVRIDCLQLALDKDAEQSSLKTAEQVVADAKVFSDYALDED